MGGVVSKKTYEVNKEVKVPGQRKTNPTNQPTVHASQPSKRVLVPTELPKPNVESITEEIEDSADATEIENKIRESVVRLQPISAAELSSAAGDRPISTEHTNKDETPQESKAERRSVESGNIDKSPNAGEPATQPNNASEETTIKSANSSKTDENINKDAENEIATPSYENNLNTIKDNAEKDANSVVQTDAGNTRLIEVLPKGNTIENEKEVTASAHVDNTVSKDNQEKLPESKHHIEDTANQQKNESKAPANSESANESQAQVRKLSANHTEPQDGNVATRPVAETIVRVEEEVTDLRKQASTPGCDEVVLKEKVIKCMITLDSLPVDTDELRAERKRVIKFAQETIAVLEKNAFHKNQSDDDSTEENTKNAE